MYTAKKQLILKTVSFFLAAVIFMNVLSMSALSRVSAEEGAFASDFEGNEYTKSDRDNTAESAVHNNHKVCTGAENCPDCGHTDVEWKEWDKSDSLPADSGNYFLSQDVTLTQSWNPPDGETSICLNGHNIISDTENFSPHTPIIKIDNENKVFNLCDCRNSGKISGGHKNYSSYGGAVNTVGIFNMYSGSLTENEALFGGGVCVESNGAFNMYGGEITGNTAELSGAGVDVMDGGEFNLHNGTISDNILTAGGEGAGAGVYNGGTFNMYNGKISNNTLAREDDNRYDTNGAGVYNSMRSTFNMYGGEISHNAVLLAGVMGEFILPELSGGGGVYNFGTFNMSGGLISYNSALGYGSGGGVYNASEGNGSDKHCAVFNMSGGEISNNTALGYGGGIYSSNDKLNLSGDSIRDNTSDLRGGGIYVGKNDSVTIGGSLVIEGNRADNICDDLFLNKDQIIIIDQNNPITENARIYVKTEIIPTENSPVNITEENVDDYSGVFFSSDTSFKTTYSNEKSVQLSIYDDDEYEHRHKVCKETENCPDCGHEEIEWTRWKQGDSLPDAPGYYALSQNVVLTESWIVPEGITYICLNNCKIIIDPQFTKTDNIINIGEKSEFNLCDCKDGGRISINIDEYGDGNEIINRSVYNLGEFNVYSGIIEGYIEKSSFDDFGSLGGGVHNKGKFNLYDGIIKDNRLRHNGAVYNDGGEFNMYGGIIFDNLAVDDHGGVCSSGVFNMYGGKINDNNGGVYLDNGIFNMIEGEIRDNHNDGVYLVNKSTFNMKSGKIIDNFGSGVYLEESTFNMKEGEIKGNSNSGVYNIHSDFKMLGGEISGNSNFAYDKGAGVYGESYGTTVIGGNAVIKDNIIKVDYNKYEHIDFYLPENYTITVDPENPLTGDACIYVVTAVVPEEEDSEPIDITGENNNDYSAYFISKNPKYQIRNGEGNIVQLFNIADQIHFHKVCEGAEKCPDCSHSDVRWQKWDGKSPITEPGSYYLTQDVLMLYPNLPKGETNICLNGHSVYPNEYMSQKVIETTQDSTLNLCDCTGTGKIIYGGAMRGVLHGVKNNGTFNMYSGTISGIYGESAVFNGKDSKFNMYGGTISELSNCNAVKNNGIFNMYGGTISENTDADTTISNEGTGTFNMYNGTISNNTANRCGGVKNNGTFNMYNGRIIGNTSNDQVYYPGGVYNENIFNMYNGVISNNTAGIGGVLNNKTFNLYDGIISENSGMIGYSGIYNEMTSEFNMYGGTISENIVDIKTRNYAGGVTVENSAQFKMLGGMIINNKISIESESKQFHCGGVLAKENAEITIGGNAVIEDNRFNDVLSDFYISEGFTITVDPTEPLTGNARIYVTTEKNPTEGTPVNITAKSADDNDYSSFFLSNKTEYEIINSENNEVQLVLTDHQHDFQPIEANKPTCEKDGNKEYCECTECGKIFDEKREKVLKDIPIIKKLGHLYGDWEIKTAPTEAPDSTGEAERICEHDQTHIDSVELKTLIDEDMWDKIEDTPATCTNEGKRVYKSEYGTVTVTREKLSHESSEEWQRNDSDHWQICKKCGVEIENTKTPHSWDEGEITREPTAEEEGEKTFTCEVCGRTKTEPIDKLEDTSTNETEPTVTPPTCETEPTGTPPTCETEPTGTPPTCETEPPVTPPTCDTEPPVTPPTCETEPPVTPPTCETEPPVTPPTCETEPPVTPPTSETEPSVTSSSEPKPETTTYSGSFAIPETTTSAVTEQIISDTEPLETKPSDTESTAPVQTSSPEEITSGSISKKAESADYIVEISDSISELANSVLTQQEIMSVNSGSKIDVLLTTDKISTVSNTDGAAIREVLNGFKMWQYLDINLYKIIDETRYKLSETYAPISIKIVIPEALRKTGRDYAMVRVHNGKGEMLEDLDDSDDTITFATDKFSVYVLVYKDGEEIRDNEKETNGDLPMNTGVDSYTSVFIATGITAMSAAMTFSLIGMGIAGMSEERKNKIYNKLIKWGKSGGKAKKIIALTLIFLLLSYYYGMGIRKGTA